MNILELDSYNLDDAVKFNEHLNPRLWGKDRHLKPDVHAHLLQIADDFREFLGVTGFELKDITISGSNAAYTYTPKSDIDLHLVVDLPQADTSEVYRELFDAKKFQYNEQHNITIGGSPVELYVQDANKKHISQGIYSVLNNKWIDVPKRKDTGVDDISTRSKYEDLAARIDTAIESENYNSMANLMTKIKTMRQTGLDQHGEFGPENLAFKMLRNQGAIERLVNARAAAKDRELSLKEREKIKQRVQYGFKTEDVGPSWDGVNSTTQQFLNEKPQPSVSEMVSAFVEYCVDQLGIEQMPVVKFKKDPQWSARNKTFGRYKADEHLLEVSLADRHVMDILRTVAHELAHARQHEVEDVPDDAGATGSRWENEANASAGILMRDYAQQHPEFFEADDLDEGIKDKIAATALAACVAGSPGCATTEPFNKSAEAVKAAVRTSQISKDDLKYGARQGIKNILRRAANANESSGYIPTKAQAKDPRFVMALTKDVQPGATGKEANKLNLNTDSQGHPELLMKGLRNALREFKEGKPFRVEVKESKEELAEDDIFEISMKPSMLRQAAANINARAGVEFEMIVPNVQGDEDYDNFEPDYDADQRSRSFSDIREFFHDGDYNSRREVDRLIEKMNEDFLEWLGEQIEENWTEEETEMVKDWVIDNVSDEDIMDAGNYDDEDRQKFSFGPDPDNEFRNKVIDDYVQNAIEKKTSDWDEAHDLYREERYGDFDESEWLQENYPYMSDVQGGFDINWPVWMTPEGGDTDIDSVASDFELAIDKPVKASSSYHSAKRDDTSYIVEPDSSLQPDDSQDGGLEFISPPMPVDEMFSDMDKIVKWANKYGCYTNESTGLHMNISVPDMSTAKLDFVKLALLMGDEYILGQFGRIANTYAKSAMKIVRDRVKERPEDAKAMLGQMKDHLGALATKVIHSGETTKYTSINTKDGYVEFRSPGGDWLGDYNSNKGKIEDTMLRFVVALDAAMDPEKYRQEYLKKLYKLLDITNETDPLKYFALYATGELPQIALKSFLKQAQLERNIKAGKTGGQDFKWEIGRPGYGASIIVVAKSKEEALDKAVGEDGYPDWASARSQLTVRPIGPADTAPVKATVNEPRPAGEVGSIKYEMFNRGSGIVMRTFYAADDQMAINIGNRYRDEAAREFDMERSTIGLRRAGGQQTPAQPQSQRIGNEFTGTWLIKDANDREIHRFSGVGNQQADANRIAMAWLRAHPDEMRDGVVVVPEMR